MRIIEVAVEAIDPVGANIMLEGHIKGLNKGEEDSKSFQRPIPEQLQTV